MLYLKGAAIRAFRFFGRFGEELSFCPGWSILG
jgi:hypothetical protein